MNFTVDDSDPSISYSANGWAVQSQNDASLDQFFQRTYHVATQDKAFMVFQFQGTAFTLYGSKGPGHATFDVQFDGTVSDNLDASASMTAFRQVLFTHSFGGAATQHLVNVTAHLEGNNRWLDLDYITFTDNGSTSSSSIGTATSTPPWLTSSSSASLTGPSGFSIPSSSSASSSNNSSSSSNKVPTILAALFGAILGLALLGVLAWLVLRRVCARHRARERAFRYGQSSVNPAAGHHNHPSLIKGAYPPSSTSGPSAKSPHEASAVMRERERTTTPYSHAPSHSHSHSQRDGSFSLASNGNAVEMQSVSTDERERVGTPATALSAASRGLMSQSPIAWTTRKMGGGHRGDADSLRTDFLQV